MAITVRFRFDERPLPVRHRTWHPPNSNADLRQVWFAFALLGTTGLAGCASHTGYESAFSTKTALAGNSHSFNAPADQTFRTVKITLVQQGFTIEQADNANGLIKAVRAFEDVKNKKISYLVTTSVDITGAPAGDATVVTASASQQTVLHKDSEKYFHLLGIVPIPTGKDYQTIVRKEGNITDAKFYNDLFAAVAKNLPKPPAVATFTAPAAVTTVNARAESTAPATTTPAAASASSDAAPPAPPVVAPVDVVTPVPTPTNP